MLPMAPITPPWYTLCPQPTLYAQVGVEGLPAVAVVDHDHVAVAPVIPAGVDHHAVIGGVDWVCPGRRRYRCRSGWWRASNRSRRGSGYWSAKRRCRCPPRHRRSCRTTRAEDVGYPRVIAADARRAPGDEVARAHQVRSAWCRAQCWGWTNRPASLIQVIAGPVDDRFGGDVVTVRLPRSSLRLLTSGGRCHFQA